MTAKQKRERAAIERLRTMLAPGDTVWTVLRHVSASGMTRSIDAYRFTPTWEGDKALAKLAELAADPRRDTSTLGIELLDIHRTLSRDAGDRLWLSRLAADAVGFGFDDKREAVRVTGAGMDMGFHLVYTLAFCVFNARPALNLGEDARLESWRKEQRGRDAGYCLSHRWL